VIWLDLAIETGGRDVLDVERWAEVRRMKHVEGLTQPHDLSIEVGSAL